MNARPFVTGERSRQCTGCTGWLMYDRMTVPRRTSGDLEFCGYQCYLRWEKRQKMQERAE